MVACTDLLLHGAFSQAALGPLGPFLLIILDLRTTVTTDADSHDAILLLGGGQDGALLRGV